MHREFQQTSTWSFGPYGRVRATSFAYDQSSHTRAHAGHWSRGQYNTTCEYNSSSALSSSKKVKQPSANEYNLLSQGNSYACIKARYPKWYQRIKAPKEARIALKQWHAQRKQAAAKVAVAKAPAANANPTAEMEKATATEEK